MPAKRRLQKSQPTSKKVKRDFYASWNEEADACMSYLHGDVADEELEAACAYEFARESEILREAATILTALKKKQPNRRTQRPTKVTHSVFLKRLAGQPMQPHESVACLFSQTQNGADWLEHLPWVLIWTCSGFPAKPWLQLSQSERGEILPAFRPKKIPPLRTMPADLLAATGILTKMSALSIEPELPELQAPVSLRPPPPAVIHEKHLTHALFTIDFRKSNRQLVKEFGAWLELPEYAQRLKDFGKNTIGTTGVCKDRLKDLAVSRLYRKLGFEKLLSFVESNRIHSIVGKPRPFHDARRGQSTKTELEVAPLCSEESFALKATDRVLRHLATFFRV